MIVDGGRHRGAANLALIAAFLISAGIVRSMPSIVGLALVSVAAGLLIAAVSGAVLAKGLWLASDAAGRLTERLLIGFGVLVSGIAIVEVVTPATGMEWAMVVFFTIVLGAAALAVLLEKRHGPGRSLIVFLVAYAFVMIAVLVWTRNDFIVVPQVDVTYFQLGGIAEFGAFRNPFAMTFPQLHGLGAVPPIYGDGVAVDGVLQFGFPYLPMSLLIVGPFQWLLSDFRVAFLAAVLGSGWMIAAMGADHRSRRIAVGFMLAGPFVTMITVGWTESLLVVAATGVVYAHQRQTALRPWIAGLFLALKQYTPIIAPAYLLLLGRPFTWRKTVSDGSRALLVVLLATIPFLVWNPDAFMRSVLLLQLKQPPRPDSISFIAHLPGLLSLPVALSLVLAMLALVSAHVYGLVTATDDAQGFALTAALALIAWLLFGRQALANYYVLVLGFVVIAAVMSTDVPQHRRGLRSEHVDRAR